MLLIANMLYLYMSNTKLTNGIMKNQSTNLIGYVYERSGVMEIASFISSSQGIFLFEGTHVDCLRFIEENQ